MLSLIYNIQESHLTKEIASGNISNTKSVEEQAQMTSNITNLIDKVVYDTKGAVKTTEESIDKLEDSTKLMQDLKVMSNELIEFNRELLDTINDFVAYARNVKNITGGIHDMSEQTNLLSLNASIESARAGEAGKGFAVVADEIRKLADETGSLTNNIDSILNKLEGKAINAQDVVGKVVDAIYNENKTIDDTMEKFGYMLQDISSLKKDMSNILNSTEDVVIFNDKIIQHIEHLSASTEEVNAYTEDALELMEVNRSKTTETKELIKGLFNVSNDLIVE